MSALDPSKKRTFKDSVYYTFDVEIVMQINPQRTTTRTKCRANAQQANDSEMDISYTPRLPVSTKTKTFINLCEKGTVHEDVHGYFISLPTNNKCKDSIPEGLNQNDSVSDLYDQYSCGDIVSHLYIVLGLFKHSVL